MSAQLTHYASRLIHGAFNSIRPESISIKPQYRPTLIASAVDELSQFLSPHVDTTTYEQYPTCTIRTTVRPQSTDTCGYYHSLFELSYWGVFGRQYDIFR